MIHYVEIDGFKSLSNFELELRPGLNVLVGPNGSGKTNIISFFEFLGDLQKMSVSDAVSNAGGAGTVFRKIGVNKYQSNITVTLSGTARLRTREFVYYKYSFGILLDPEAELLEYYYQRIQAKTRTVGGVPKRNICKFDLDVKVRYDNQREINIVVNEFNKHKIKSKRYMFHSKEKLTEYIKSNFPTRRSLPLILRRGFRIWGSLYRDLAGGEVFNIEPSKVKMPEDSAKYPRINKDGSGLYATLYTISNREKERAKTRYDFGFMNSMFENTGMSEILQYLRLANEAINKIRVYNDRFDNRIRVRITVGEGKGNAVLPLSAMSDGTIKWLSLLTIILTNQSTFSVEEPENYLHPLMQSEIIKLMRSKIEKNRFALLSTHSETILNNTMPEEVVVISFSDGRTFGNRPRNINALNKEIQRTGFGLGYYYIAGSLDNE